MTDNEAIIKVGTVGIHQAVQQLKGKTIPNMSLVEDTHGFRLVITLSDLNLAISTLAAPVEEVGPGNFLVTLHSYFLNPDVVKDGYTLTGSPSSAIIQMNFPMFAETELELTDGILQLINDESENIICQILEAS